MGSPEGHNEKHLDTFHNCVEYSKIVSRKMYLGVQCSLRTILCTGNLGHSGDINFRFKVSSIIEISFKIKF